MTIYRVLMPAAADAASAAERAVFIRDGFCWPALLFGPVWLLCRGLWRALALWCLGAAVLATAIGYGFFSVRDAGWLYLLSVVFLALEGHDLVARARERAGFRFVDVAVGETRAAAERGFFSRRFPDTAPAPAPARPGPPAAPPHVIGMFPEAGG